MTDPRLLLARLQKSLHILQQQEAKYGLDAPASLKLEIIDHQTAITLTEQLAAGHLTETAWREQLQPLLVKIEEHQATKEVNNLNIGGVNFSHISHSTITVGNIDASVHFHPAESAPPDQAALAAAEQRYRAALKAAFADDAAAYIPLAGETTEITTPNPQPKLSPRAAQRLRRRAGAEYEKLVGQGQEIKRVKLNTLREAVDQYDCIILLGAPGSGKTTSLENLAYQLADEPERIPLLLRLSEFGSDQSLDAFIRRGWGGAALAGYWDAPLLAGQLDTYLAAGKLFILFDAMNEMPQQGYKQHAAELRRFIDRWAKAGNRFMVTCRVLDYGEELTGLQRVEVLPFSDEQIKTSLQNELPEGWKHLWAELTKRQTQSKNRQPLIELARNPYLLTMMIDVYAVQGELGRNRAKLMEQFTTILLEWAKDKVPPEQWITIEAQQQVLATLAYEMQIKAGSGARVAVADVADALPGEVKRGSAWPAEPTPPDRVLTLAASANLIEMPGDRSSIRFYHQLLQEYFTARYIVDNNRYGDLMAYITDDHWREVFLLTAGLASDAGDFFRHFRTALDGLLTPEPALIDLLRWTNRKSAGNILSPLSVAILKAYYILLARGRNLTSALARDHALGLVVALTHDLAFVVNLANDFTLAGIGSLDRLDLASDRDLKLARNIARFNISTSNRTLKRAREIACAIEPGLALDYLLTAGLQNSLIIEYVHQIDDLRALSDILVTYFGQVIQEASQVSPELAAGLTALSIPTKNAPQTAWQEFNRQLRRLMLDHRDLGHEWDLNEEQLNKLADYHKASQLLLECLDVASVDNPEAIINSLLSPPGEWDF